jgi:asparagine synthase (glutamine-hydrolysing)
LPFFVDIYSMCGISGIIIANQPSEVLQTADGLRSLKKMTNALAHRGPDGEGGWCSEKGNAYLGHRRLSVIDLSDAASQPMQFGNRYTIVHNGEIYNHIELRAILQQKGYTFQTRSDTELILAAYDHWKEKCLQQFDGMFAFAIWDEKEQELFAARDRFGEKPFYYYEDAEHFVFASEMKALWALGIEKKTDRKMLLNFLTLGHVQNSMDKEQTFFEDIYSLPPAHYLKFCTDGFNLVIEKYWNINKEIRIDIAAADAIEKFTELFNRSVQRRLRSDVTVGTSLSGGIDSSSIVSAILEQYSTNSAQPPGEKLKSFSAVFPGFEKDESKYIRTVSDTFGIKNFQVTPTADDLVRDFEKLCYHQEEPFQSSGIYAQYKVFELAKQQQVTVLLDGQGADETLAGYPRYIHWYLQEVLSRHKIGATQKERAKLQKNKQLFRWDIKNVLAAFLPAHAAIQLEKTEYRRTMRHPDISAEFLRSVAGRDWEGIHKPIVTKLNDILYFNVMELGLEELLRFADRNSMAHGREVRLPFLDHQLVEFIFSLPAQFKIHEGWTKWILRRAMNKKLPDDILWRTDKTGYEPPQQQWMKDPLLQDYMQEAKRKLVKEKILSQRALDKKIEPKPAYIDNNYDWRYLCAAHII